MATSPTAGDDQARIHRLEQLLGEQARKLEELRNLHSFDMLLVNFAITALQNEIGLRLSYVPGVVAGSAPPAGTKLIIKANTQVVTVGASGLWSLTFPGGAFPNGLVSAVATPGDDASALTKIALEPGSSSLSVLGGHAYTSGTTVVANGSNIRVNWIALGW